MKYFLCVELVSCICQLLCHNVYIYYIWSWRLWHGVLCRILLPQLYGKTFLYH